MRLGVWLLAAALLLSSACSSGPTTKSPDQSPTPAPAGWVDEEVSFVDGGLTTYATYRHRADAPAAPAALLISESGNTDRNGDNAVAGKIGTLRALAALLSERGLATLRYDKVGTGKTQLGPYKNRQADVGAAVFTAEAKAAARFLAQQPRTDPNRISVYGHGEGAVRALVLATDTSAGAPKIHALGLLQPLAGRYLDLITNRLRKDTDAQVQAGKLTAQQAREIIAAWLAAVAQARSGGTVPGKLPHGLSAILNPGNVKAVLETDAIDPLALAAQLPAAMPVLLTCSDSDGQASCEAVQPLATALANTALAFLALKGVSHVLKDDPTDNIANYPKDQPLSPQLVNALDEFVSH